MGRDGVRVVILNSAQSKHPPGDAAWVRSTLAATEHFARQGHTLITSVGMCTWELVLWKAATHVAPLDVLCPVPRHSTEARVVDELCEQFALCRDRVQWKFLRSAGRSERLKDTWQERDRLAVMSADVICPVSVRSGGKLDRWLSHPDVLAHRELRFRVPFERARVGPVAARFDSDIDRSGLPPGQRLVMHFTRSSDGPWPGERKHDYYRALAEGGTGYPRDGFCTLRRIVREARIRASSLRIRGGVPTVSLTALDPRDALGLVRWRKRFARYAFEPYAIGLPERAAERLGARPVIYDTGSARRPRSSSDDDPLLAFRQGRGTRGDWEAEQEWRLVGDLDLSALAPNEVVVFVASPHEATELRGTCAYPVVSFGRSPDPISRRRASRR